MASLFESEEERKKIYEQIFSEIKKNIEEENRRFDPTLEESIQERLSKLDERSINEFYNARERRTLEKDIRLSNNKLDLLTLESLEKSFDFYKKHEENVNLIKIPSQVANDDNIILNPYEIKLLDYLDGHSATHITLPQYFSFDFNLDLDKSINRLIQGNFIEIANLEFTLSKTKVKELKNFLEQKGLKKMGTKDILISRILDNFDKKVISDYFNEIYFKVTKKGKLIIDKNPQIFFAHNYYNQLNISIKKICEYKKISKNLDFHKDFIEIILMRAKESIDKKDWGSYRNDLYSLSIVYKDLKDCLMESVLLLYVCYYDYQDILKSFVDSFVREISYYINTNEFTIQDLENKFFEYSFDVFPCDIDKQTFFNIFIDNITLSE